MKLASTIRESTDDRRRRRDFGLFWASLSATVVADQVREFAIPLIAVTVLHVSAVELGVLGAAQWLPFLLLSLPLGVVVDRHRRRRMLVLSESGRGLVSAGLVVAAATAVIGFPVLVLAAVALGALTVIYEVGYQSVIPSLVPRSRLDQANARIQATFAAGEIGGPGLAGFVLQAAGMVTTLALTTAGYLGSAVLMMLMRTPEERPPAADRRHFVTELREGARHVVRDPYLRANVGFSALYNPFAQWVTLLLTLYAVEDLGLDATQIGLVFSIGAAGALLGAAATRVSARLRVGTVLVLCASVECAALLVIPLVEPTWSHPAAIAVIGAVLALNGAGTALSSVLLITIRQLRTPDRLLGRVNATMRCITYGTIPLGAVAGGLAGQWFGVRMGLLIGAVLCLPTVVWVVVSPLARVRRLADLAVSEDDRERDPAGVPGR